jgi:hypothetical protein
MLSPLPDETPALQRWVITSNPTNKLVWPKKSYSQFQKELPTLLTQVQKPLYRGTKFPWIEGRHKNLKTSKQAEREIQDFLDAFDSRTPFILPSLTSFTTKKTLAKKFASEAKGFEVLPSLTFDQGFLHCVEPPVKGVDIYGRLQEETLVKLKGSDELFVAKEEKEVLLLPGTVLIPKSRTSREFKWIAIS